MIQRYGNPYSMQNRQIRVKASLRYYYDNKTFDSSPEVAFYIYHKDHGIEIEYCIISIRENASFNRTFMELKWQKP